MFITRDDLLATMRAENLDGLIDEDDETLDKCILHVVSFLSGLLGTKFDMATVLAATGDARNQTLVRWGCDLVAKELYKRLAPNQIPAYIEDEAKSATMWLKSAAAGEYDFGLPLRDTTEATGSTVVKFGGQTIQQVDY